MADKYLILFMLQKQCHWTCVIRILELVIIVRSAHMPSKNDAGSNSSGYKKFNFFIFGEAGVTVAILFLMRGTKLGFPCLLWS